MKAHHLRHIHRLITHNEKNEERKAVHIDYHKASTKRRVKRKVDPLKVKGSVLVAYDHKRKAIRSFRIDRIKSMEKSAFWNGFLKRANLAAELGGLGMLAIPSASHLAGKPLSEKRTHQLEIAGLGTLAAPYAWQAGKKLLTKGRAK